jgi:uncharacterized protein (TIGR02453 family)
MEEFNGFPRESQVLRPALAFIDAVGQRLPEVSPHFRAVAKRSGGSLGSDVHAPGYYFHVEPGEYFVCAGIWHPESKVVTRIREFMADNPAAWKRARAYPPFKHFELVGDSLKRPPRGYLPDHVLIEDLKRKDFMGCKALAEEAVCGPELVDTILESMEQAAPLMDYLCTALDLQY